MAGRFLVFFAALLDRGAYRARRARLLCPLVRSRLGLALLRCAQRQAEPCSQCAIQPEWPSEKGATQTEWPCYPYEHGYLVVDPDDLFIPRPARTLSLTQHHHHGPIIACGRPFGRGGVGDVAICNLRPARWCGTASGNAPHWPTREFPSIQTRLHAKTLAPS